MKKYINILIMTTFVSITSTVMTNAQNHNDSATVNRTVVVEQNYAPIIQDAAKINHNPSVLAAPITRKNIEYIYTNQPVNRLAYYNMPSLIPNIKTKNISPLYVFIGGGTLGNIKAIADFRANISKRDIAHITFNYGGKNAYLTNKNIAPNEYNSYLYSGNIGITYMHDFNKLRLGGTFKYTNNRFNYIPGSVNKKQQEHIQHGEIFTSSLTGDLLSWDAKVGFNNYLKNHTLWQDGKKLQERNIFLEGNARYKLSDSQSLGIWFTTDFFSYNRTYLKEYVRIHTTPKYTYQEEDIKISAGVNLDLSLNFDTRIRISPEFEAAYTFADKYMLYTKFVGGNNNNTLQEMNNLCIYGETDKLKKSTYIPLNASVGIKAAPIEGLQFNLFAGYENRINDLVFYTQKDNMSYRNSFYIDFANINTKTPYLGINAYYDYKGIVQTSISTIFRKWKTEKQEYKTLLAFKPQQEINMDINYNILPTISLGTNYQYIKRVGNISSVSNLCMNGRWNFFKHWTASIEVYNVLNNRYLYFDQYISDGISGLLGISFQW